MGEGMGAGSGFWLSGKLPCLEISSPCLYPSSAVEVGLAQSHIDRTEMYQMFFVRFQCTDDGF
jgi:hypothetical protein